MTYTPQRAIGWRSWHDLPVGPCDQLEAEIARLRAEALDWCNRSNGHAAEVARLRVALEEILSWHDGDKSCDIARQALTRDK